MIDKIVEIRNQSISELEKELKLNINNNYNFPAIKFGKNKKVEGILTLGDLRRLIKKEDISKKAKNFINELGNPYTNVGIDEQGRTGIDWGVYGIPESFIIHNGKVIYKHIGPIHISELDDTILPILKDLK